MRPYLFAVPALLLGAIAPSIAHSAAPPNGNAEAHLVSIYEGFEKTGNQIHGPKAIVNVSRPGKRVTLVLTSYSGATWHISASKDTIIEKVILGGYEKQAVAGLPESTSVVHAGRETTNSPLPYAYDINSIGFRRLVRQVCAITHCDLASFHGAYRPTPESPFSIDSVQDDPRLSVAYPEVTPKTELPEDARQVTFMAHYYSQGPGFHDRSTSFGKYTVTGPIEETLTPLPKGVSRIAYDPVGKSYYGISGHGVVEVDLENQTTKSLELGLDVPRLSWPCEITFDTERRRAILGTSGGGGYLYAYSPQSMTWSVISERPGALDAFTYSPADDCIYGVAFQHGENGDVPSLCKVNMNGAVVRRMPLGEPIVRGSLGTGPGVCSTEVAVAGGYLAVLASPGGLGGRERPNGWYIYLIDPETGRLWLTSKRAAAD